MSCVHMSCVLYMSCIIICVGLHYSYIYSTSYKLQLSNVHVHNIYYMYVCMYQYTVASATVIMYQLHVKMYKQAQKR